MSKKELFMKIFNAISELHDEESKNVNEFLKKDDLSKANQSLGKMQACEEIHGIMVSIKWEDIE